MPRFINIRNMIAAIAIVAISSLSITETQAFGPGASGQGFFPYGFYQPYGAQYGTSLRTPPYFATNPPVYYGARHSRPYGLSPFAAPPMVSAGQNYRSQLRSEFIQPRTPTYAPATGLDENCGCAACASADPHRVAHHKTVAFKLGQVQSNPFVVKEERIAQK